MIIYPDVLAFHAAPGTEIERVTSLMEMTGQKHESFLDAIFDTAGTKTDLPVVTLINHPYQWLENCFRWKVFNLPMMDIVVPPILLRDNHFAAFVESIYSYSTDVYGRLHRQYRSDVTIRAEDLPWCLFELLESFNVEIPEEPIPPLAKRDVYDDDKVIWTPRLRKLVQESEEKTFETYEYY